MSDTKKHVNSELPDQDALAAFANTALGSSRRRRRSSQETPAASEPADTSAAAAETVKPPQETPKQAPQPEPGPEPETVQPAPPVAAEQPEATVPSPAPAPAAETETKPEPAPSPPAAATTGAAPETATATGSREARPSTEVEVRAVSVPVTRTPTPPGLQGGTIEVQVPALGPTGARATQCTVMISTGVRDRFAHYQLAKKVAGEREPSNALVIRRAFIHAKRANLFGKLLADLYHQTNALDEEDYDEDGLLGDVIGRRTIRGRLKETGQQSFRPSEQELATYDAFSQAYGFPSRSDFLDCVLDEFLPQLPASGRRR